MQDLQTLEEIEKIEQSLNNIDLNETIPLEATKTNKKKRVLSEKQLNVLALAREKLKEKTKERLIQKRLEQEAIEDEVQKRLNEYKTGLEQKVVRKAISIKKKQIKKEAVLEEISDDETPIQKIKEIAKKKNHPAPQPAVNAQPQFIFV